MIAGPFKIGVDDDTGADLGFVLSCLALGVITMDELHLWIHHVIAQTPGGDVPPHLMALLAVKNRANVFRPNDAVMRRLPHDPFITDARFEAMTAMSRLVRPEHGDTSGISEAEAEATLRRHPEVVDRFCALFPFIKEKVA